MLRSLATSCIDVSDGLLADLGHILESSGVAAELRWNALPRSAAIDAISDVALRARCVLAGGDDYELCFTAPSDRRIAIQALEKQAGVRLSRVGRIGEGRGLRVVDADNQPVEISVSGFDHFNQ